MPSHYAHYRFGRQALQELPPDVRQCIQRFRRMYDMGQHGPDLFFYYSPFAKTAIGDLGKTFHRQSGQEFFTRVCAQVDSEAGRAYLYGLLGHYCLDSVCHPFVHQMVNIGEAGHVALESEFERHLLAKDGQLPPHTQDRTRHMKLTRGECMTVAGFYPPAAGGAISRSVWFMGWATRFLAKPNRDRIEKLLKGIRPELIDHMVPEVENPDYVYMIGELQTLYDQALARYPALIGQLQNHMQTGEPLGEDFAPNFG